MGTLAFFGERPEILQEVVLSYLTTKDCKSSAIDFSVTNNMVCATAPGKDACTFDSGGGLILENRSRWFLVGTTSFSMFCALSGYPGVCTKVINYLQWIHDVTNENFYKQ